MLYAMNQENKQNLINLNNILNGKEKLNLGGVDLQYDL